VTNKRSTRRAWGQRGRACAESGRHRWWRGELSANAASVCETGAESRVTSVASEHRRCEGWCGERELDGAKDGIVQRLVVVSTLDSAKAGCG
jgi:hypothetical protein